MRYYIEALKEALKNLAKFVVIAVVLLILYKVAPELSSAVLIILIFYFALMKP